MGTLNCPAEEALVELTGGRLSGEALARVQSHAASCSRCQLLLAATDKMPHEPPRPPQSRGTQVGRYTVLASVGSGAMGEVYAAYDPRLDRRVALKLLHADAGRDRKRAQARLLREAKAMAKLSHPNVVAVHDTGTFEGRVYVAMEYVDGATLKDWMAERPRSPQEIIAAFSAAARGLAAAHAAGIVHRDFKPANVMIGRDGAVRVTDFGLAHLSTLGAPQEDEDDAPGPPDPHLTRIGDFVGTPLFMAPEQFARRATDARTDQFSFCVALYGALYGAPPFAARTIEVLAARVVAGRVEPAPPKSAVPAWLRAVLLRGLSADPASRWPAMEDLVAALQGAPARLRRRQGLTAGVAVLVGLSALALVRGSRPSAAPLCLGGPGRLAGIWDDAPGPGQPRPRRDALAATFLASGAPDARDVWDRVAALLDRYRDGWLAMYREACEATQVRREQPARVLDLRMTCLDDRRRALSALTDVFASADRDVVRNAVAAANALPAIAPCADRRQLEAPVEPPRDEAAQREVQGLRARLATAKALDDAGKHEQAAAMLRRLLERARATGYRTLIAEITVALGRCFTLGTYGPDVLPAVEEGLSDGLGVGRDDLAAEASVVLAGLSAYSAEFDGSRDREQLAEVLLDRAGPGHELLRALFFHDESTLERRRHHREAALAFTERALAIREKALPPDHPEVGLTLGNVAECLADLGRNREALDLNRRAQEILVRAYGAESIEAGMTLNNGAEMLIDLGRPAEALEPLRRALAVWEAQLGTSHHYLAYPLTATGRALLALARPAEAVPPLERALHLREAGEPDPSLVAETRFALARALWDAGPDRQRARELAARARAGYATADEQKHVGEIDAWLAAAPRARQVR